VSSVFTQNGEGFYLVSPSEMARFSVSAHVVTRPCCVVRRHATQEPQRSVPHSIPRRSSPSRTSTNHRPPNDRSPGWDRLTFFVQLSTRLSYNSLFIYSALHGVTWTKIRLVL